MLFHLVRVQHLACHSAWKRTPFWSAPLRVDKIKLAF
jgi:hypothetical protein